MSWPLAAVNLFFRYVAKPRLRRTTTPALAAREFARLAALTLRQPPCLRRIERPGGLHWISAGPCEPRRVLLYFHGGGYISGSPATHQGMLGRLSSLSRIEVCAPAYPLVQDAPFPAAFEAATQAWRHCRALGYEPHHIVLGGDSAGGSLALALLAWCCQQGEPPAAALAFSPWTDLAMTGQSLQRNSRSDPLLPVERIGELVETVLGAASRDDPRISPLYAAFPGCPPVMIHYSRTEILADDARRMAARLEHFGAEVRLEAHPDAPHVWPILDGWVPEARRTLRETARFVQASLAETSR